MLTMTMIIFAIHSPSSLPNEQNDPEPVDQFVS